MIIAITGSVGTGKTTISKNLSKKLNIKCLHLNLIAKKFKIEDKKNLQTFNFNCEKLCQFVEKNYLQNKNSLIIESHFSHFLNPKLIDILFVITRNLKDLRLEYKKRKYNFKKIEENLDVEKLNLCFYESFENGFSKKKVFLIENLEISSLIKQILLNLKKNNLIKND